ncbi:MAG: M56 family metallopeptidase [Lachnospiraceae bacterium]|nr:M56 family metallopeptidase [Lachnospiraceae bacterium]
MSDIFLAVINMSISSVAMILAVLFLRTAIKNGSKSVRCLLWVPVGILLVVPILSGKEIFLTSVDNFSQESVGEPVEAVQIAEASSILTDAQSDTESSEIEENVQTRLESIVYKGVVGKVWAILSNEIAGGSPGILQIRLSGFAVTVGTAVWLCGCAVLLLYTWIRYFLLKRKLRVSVCIYENIFICDEIDTPFVLGGLHPCIYLPSHMQERQIPYVVAHERAHLSRKDNLWKKAAFLLLTIHWFNPFVWIAYHDFCRDIELACDERVIRRYQATDKKAYADALLSCSVQKRYAIASPLSFGMIGIKERIVFIVEKEKPKKKKMICNAFSCSLLLLCFWAVAMTRTTCLAAESTESDVTTKISDETYNRDAETAVESETEPESRSFEENGTLDIVINRGVTVYQYTGEAFEPPVVLLYYLNQDGDYDILRENVDYTVAYENNTEVGTGEIIITGIGDYCGEAYAEFTIIDPIEEVKIDSSNFPDDLFRAYVSRNFDTDHNGILNDKEILDVRDIDLTECYDPCTGIYVKDLTGAECFVMLKNLYCVARISDAEDLSGLLQTPGLKAMPEIRLV